MLTTEHDQPRAAIVAANDRVLTRTRVPERCGVYTTACSLRWTSRQRVGDGSGRDCGHSDTSSIESTPTRILGAAWRDADQMIDIVRRGLGRTPKIMRRIRCCKGRATDSPVRAGNVRGSRPGCSPAPGGYGAAGAASDTATVYVAPSPEIARAGNGS